MKQLDILTTIKDQLVNNGGLLLPQQKFLIDALTRIESGEPIEVAFESAKLPEMERGKKSVQYRVAKKSRDNKLARAFSLLEGSNWKRCSQLASLVFDIRSAMRGGYFQPSTETERLIVRAIKTGVNVPATPRGIHKALFLNN